MNLQTYLTKLTELAVLKEMLHKQNIAYESSFEEGEKDQYSELMKHTEEKIDTLEADLTYIKVNYLKTSYIDRKILEELSNNFLTF